MVKIAPAAAVLAAIAAPLAWAPLSAGTVTSSMAVSATVEQACYLDVRPVRFGDLRSDATRAEADSALAVQCTPNTAFVVSMDNGQHHAEGGRRMAAGGGEFLAYELYSDAARTRRWGASLTESVGGQVSGESAVTLPIYARVEAVQAKAGAYSDVVTVTVSF